MPFIELSYRWMSQLRPSICGVWVWRECARGGHSLLSLPPPPPHPPTWYCRIVPPLMTPGCTVRRCPTSASAASSASSSSSSAASLVPPWCLPRARCAAALEEAAAEADGMKCLKMSACLSKNCMRFWRRVACGVCRGRRGKVGVCEVGARRSPSPCPPSLHTRGVTHARAPHPATHSRQRLGKEGACVEEACPPPPRCRFHPPPFSPRTWSCANAASSPAFSFFSSSLRSALTLRMRSRSRRATSRRASLERAACVGGGDVEQREIDRGSDSGGPLLARAHTSSPLSPAPLTRHTWNWPCSGVGSRVGRVARPASVFLGAKAESPARVRARSAAGSPPRASLPLLHPTLTSSASLSSSASDATPDGRSSTSEGAASALAASQSSSSDAGAADPPRDAPRDDMWCAVCVCV